MFSHTTIKQSKQHKAENPTAFQKLQRNPNAFQKKKPKKQKGQKTFQKANTTTEKPN